MAANKYDRFGFDKYGYNKDGYDRMGYNREGYDRHGYNRQGLNRKGINKLTGLDKDGFDSSGFNKDGYDREGYDREGYNQDGYNREGYDRYGYDREGYNEDGYNRSGYDREGFDEDGYDFDGYDREGYSKSGYNSDGYDRAGFDRFGYNNEGYNYRGYDREGYDKNGLNAEGYDRDGYDWEGFDKEGFNRYGIDRYGYNREGFDEDGYDREGYNRLGYNKNGYDRDGFDENGYDKEGYNSKGFTKDGFDRDGFDIFGFNIDGLTKDGFDIYGLSEDGYNILGYDSDGFDENGFSIDGFSKDSFDEDGFHIYSGFNLKGFDRDGFNINGIDAEGYDRQGYHFLTGLDRTGFDRDGFSSVGLDRYGYNRKGFDSKGYDKEGYNIDGYNKEGYDRRGYNRNGYDKRGYDINGYNADGILDPNIQKEFVVSDENDPQQDKFEAIYHKKCEHQINNYYKQQVEKEERKNTSPISRRYIDRWGFVQYDVRYPDEEAIRARINNRVDAVLRNPYFCHIDYNDNPELYIGKQAVHGWITDWADSRASYYYQYQMYIGNTAIGLNFVRDVYIKDRKYKGYKDLYNKLSIGKGYANVADSHLSQIIQANQSNKKIHDIIESIQQNQYTIITSDKEAPSVVLGCAGSGKTMILMHKIRYMKYNYSDLSMDQVFVISPTDILGKESRELSALLQVDQVRQFTASSLYEYCCVELLDKLAIPYETIHVDDLGIDRIEYYKLSRIAQLKKDVQKQLSNISSKGESYERENNYIDELMRRHISVAGLKKKNVNNAYKLYTDSVSDIRKAGKKDVSRLITQIASAIRNRDALEDLKDLVEFIYQSGLFPEKESEKKIETNEFTKLFSYTRQAVQSMDYGEFLRVRYIKNLEIDSLAQLVQIMQLFMDEKLDLGDIRNLLYELCNVSSNVALEYIQYAKDTLDRMNRLERKKVILQYLIDNDMVSDTVIDHNNLRYDTAFDKLVKLYDTTEEQLEKRGYTPFTYFREYHKLATRKKRLEEQTKDPEGKSYLFYTILSVLRVKENYKEDITIHQTEAFQMAYILCGYAGSIDKDKKYVFIDEFQNFAPSEIELISRLYPSAVVNLFGDIDQCISNKGIHKTSEIPGQYMKNKPYKINENYRNARQITEYINTTFKMKMLPVGLDGIQKNVISVPDLAINDDDRVAIIVANEHIYIHQRAHNKYNYFTKSREIKRGVYNIIPVKSVKGLEFEKVIVAEREMTKNEFYVACTRAISELYVIREEDRIIGHTVIEI